MTKESRTSKISRRDMLRVGGFGLLAAGTGLPLSAQSQNPVAQQALSTQTPPAQPAPTQQPPRDSGMTHVRITADNPAVVRDRTNCTRCGDCLNYCHRYGTVQGHRSVEGRESCINCGQCSIRCQPHAITERSSAAEFRAALDDPQTVVIATVSPAVRIALGEMFRMSAGSYVEGQLVASLKKLGCDRVLDTTFAADMTVMEEAAELLHRLGTQPDVRYPLFTSCCPAWVRFAELFMPQLLPHISTTKSPIMIQGATIKTFFADSNAIDPKHIFNVAITPCTAKKAEILSERSNTLASLAGYENLREIDCVITTRELGDMLKQSEIDFARLPNAAFDSLMGRGSGSGVDFGRNGGVMESAMRTAYYLVNGTDAPMQKTIETPRGEATVSWVDLAPYGRMAGVRETTLDFGRRKIRVAAAETTGSLRALLDAIEHDGERFDFVEVMACQGGCLGGGGQPYPVEPAAIPGMIDHRKDGIRTGVEQSHIRLSHENKDVQLAYREFYGQPHGETAEKLLHCK